MKEEMDEKLKKVNEEMNTPFAKVKFAIATIQFNYLSMNEEKTAIEANPSSHRIAEYCLQYATQSKAPLLERIKELEEGIRKVSELMYDFDTAREGELKAALKQLLAK